MTDKLFHLVDAENASVSAANPADFGILGNSAALRKAFKQLCAYARFGGSVLIVGATGTGKELFAQALHKLSGRLGPLITVDCASLPETLVESSLFGHCKGAFTGANASKTGLVRLADQGTLFLDEVAEMPLHVQKKFLRVLQERRFLPVGSTKELRSDFRVVAATNRDLREMVAAGRFREDLYYRLRTLALDLPPLNRRGGDVLHIAANLLEKLNGASNPPPKRLSKNMELALSVYPWPGNVRELVNALESAFAAALDSPVLDLAHLPSYMQSWLNENRAAGKSPSLIVERRNRRRDRRKADATGQGPTLADPAAPVKTASYCEARRKVLERFERDYLRDLYSRCNADISQACSMAGLSRPRLYELYRKHNILSLKSS